jgi:hypothetical protein
MSEKEKFTVEQVLLRIKWLPDISHTANMCPSVTMSEVSRGLTGRHVSIFRFRKDTDSPDAAFGWSPSIFPECWNTTEIWHHRFLFIHFNFNIQGV